eukprot:14657768-Alexandrium_andersonii.AAC.1
MPEAVPAKPPAAVCQEGGLNSGSAADCLPGARRVGMQVQGSRWAVAVAVAEGGGKVAVQGGSGGGGDGGGWRRLA